MTDVGRQGGELRFWDENNKSLKSKTREGRGKQAWNN